MTTRMQVTLDPDLHTRAVRRAADEGISLAELIRRLLSQELTEVERPRVSVDTIVGIGSSGGSHVRLEKNRYLGEALDADRAAQRS